MKLEMIILSIGISIAVILITILIIYTTIGIIKEKQREREQPSSDTSQDLPDTKYVNAKVISKRIFKSFTNDFGMGVATSSLEYYIKFLIDSGTEVEYSVSQEMFDKVTENQEGILVTVNDCFFDFGDGENIVEEDCD